MNPIDAISAELKNEAPITRRMLERVPPDKLAWKPHTKSRTLGEVAGHIAGIPGVFLGNLLQDEFDHAAYHGAVATVPEILETFDRNVARAFETLAALKPEQLLEKWSYRRGEHMIFELPRFVVIRSSTFNHMIHHRGQLSVYLRLLDVPLPGVYGPSADEPMR